MSRVVVVLLVLVAGCTSSPAAPDPDLGPVGPVTRTPSSTQTFDCGTVDLRRLRASEISRHLAAVDGCVGNALLDGQPARSVRVSAVGGTAVRTTYVVTGRGELTIRQTIGAQTRDRRCTHATSLSHLGACSRDPGPGG